MYHWNPSDYATHSSAQFAWARELIDKLALQGEERVLDIGCGDGKITAEIASLLPRGSVTGMDKSVEMIRFARGAFPRERHPNLSFLAADASALPFGKEFDVVFSNAALHWITDHRPVLAGIARNLRPGGRLLLQMGGKGNAASILAVLDELLREPAWSGYFEGFSFPYGFHSPEEYRGWLEEAGLTPRRVELIPKDMAQEGAEGLAGWVRTTWLPYTGRIPDKLREAFIREVVERSLARHPLDADGKAHVSMMRLEVEAGKESPKSKTQSPK
ncbi:MAG: class I SAM-dependent methyltransferase [Candidatus Latescibacterota bacterium]